MNIEKYNRDSLVAVESTENTLVPILCQTIDGEKTGRLSLDEARSIMFRRCNSHDRLPLLIDFATQMKLSEWLTLLGEIWEVCDDVTYYIEDLFDQTPFVQLVRNPTAWRDHMMTAEERIALDKLQPRVTIYRGCYEDNKAGLSWSLDRQIAAGFPFLNRYRSHGQPLLIEASIARGQILAFKHGRAEAEVIAWQPMIEAVSHLKKP